MEHQKPSVISEKTGIALGVVITLLTVSFFIGGLYIRFQTMQEDLAALKTTVSYDSKKIDQIVFKLGIPAFSDAGFKASSLK